MNKYIKVLVFLIVFMVMIFPIINVNADVKKGLAREVVINNLTSGDTYDDGVDTFITGENPNNYIWYSGKLWRAVSVNNSSKTVKLVTQWTISAISYSSGSIDFAGSYMESWLNDTTVDGFLGNLREPEKFIVMDAKWDTTEDNTKLGSIKRPNGISTVTTSVGLLNMYEYQMSNNGGSNGYLNNGLWWWTLTPYSSSQIRMVALNGIADHTLCRGIVGVRPSINLQSSIKIVSGSGTEKDPYRLAGDNDSNLRGTLLNTRYSGEYIRFGNDENSLYQIVSHENGTGTKIVSAEPLKSSGTFISMNFGNSHDDVFSPTNTIIGKFLSGKYLTNYVDSAYSNMIEDSTIWYLGNVGNQDSTSSYKLAKYTDTTGTTLTSDTVQTKVGLLRYGELMSGQFDRYENNQIYWTLTPYGVYGVLTVFDSGDVYIYETNYPNGIRPSVNLKSNIVITEGTGTKEDPFILADRLENIPSNPDLGNDINNPETDDNIIIYACLAVISLFSLVTVTKKAM